MIHQVQSGHRLSRPSCCSEAAFDIIKACWNEDPADRPTFQLLCQSVEALAVSVGRQPRPSHLYDSVKVVAAQATASNMYSATADEAPAVGGALMVGRPGACITAGIAAGAAGC